MTKKHNVPNTVWDDLRRELYAYTRKKINIDIDENGTTIQGEDIFKRFTHQENAQIWLMGLLHGILYQNNRLYEKGLIQTKL